MKSSPAGSDQPRRSPNSSIATSDADEERLTANHNDDHPSPSRDAGTRRAQPARRSPETLPYDSSLFPDHITGELRHEQSRPHSRSPVDSPTSSSPATSTSWAQKARHKWLMSKGMVMVMIAQFFGASMNVMTRILELDGSHGDAMDPFEILLVRMLGTVICSVLYMWYAKVPNPLGISSVRGLLFIRGVAGFFGVFGLYHSLLYLPLSEATVLTFLSPILCCYACSLIMPDEVFSKKQQIAGVGSLVGVILIARPMSLFSSEAGTPEQDPSTYSNTTTFSNHSSPITTMQSLNRREPPDDVDATHRLIGIVAALVGVLGGTVAYTIIRKIGQRAHALVSVTYFSVLTTIISIIAVVAIPSVTFRLPNNWTELLLLSGLATSGFLLQFLLTAGLAYEPPSTTTTTKTTANADESNGEPEKHQPSTHGSRATSMVYTQMLFALFYDKLVWDATPSAMSWAGSGIILCSAVYVALAQDGGGQSNQSQSTKPEEDEAREPESGVEQGHHEDLTPWADEDAADANGSSDGARRGRIAAWWNTWRTRSRSDSPRFDEEHAHHYERRSLLGGSYENDIDEHDERDR